MPSIHSNHSNIQISMKFSEMKTEAPDGGLWGWLAVFGCFMGNLIGDGIMYRRAWYSLSQCDYLRWTSYKDENMLFSALASSCRTSRSTSRPGAERSRPSTPFRWESHSPVVTLNQWWWWWWESKTMLILFPLPNQSWNESIKIQPEVQLRAGWPTSSVGESPPW